MTHLLKRVPRTRLWEHMEDRIMFDAAPDVDTVQAMEEAPQEDMFAPAMESGANADGTNSLSAENDGAQQSSAQVRRELVVVDTTVANYQQLVDDILGESDPHRDIDVVMLESDADGLQAISNILAGYSGLDAVHLVSHGTDAAVQLGNVWLSASNLDTYASQIAGWAGAFSSDGDLLIYGCHLGDSASGRELVESLGELTETDVAASIDDTGYAPRGGDWDFEYTVGTVETSVAFSDQAQQHWTGLLAVGPDAQLNVPATVPLGESFSFTVTFSNTGNPGEIGYGPFIDLIFPVNGADGAAGTDTPDGLDFAGATYLGASVNAIEIIFPDDDGAGPGTTGTINHPFAVDNTGTPLQVTGTAGDKLVVLELPFGSFTPEQPAADIIVSTTMSNLADLGTPLTIATRAGFRYGADPLDNPTSDPSILSDTQTDSSAWVEAATVTPALLSMTKTEIAPESETATGPNYIRQYRIDIDIADGQTITDFDITDALPNNIVFQSLDTLTSSDVTTTFNHNAAALSTTLPQNGAQLLVNADTVTGGAGTDITIVYSFFVPEFDADAVRIIPIDGEDDLAASISTNTADALGDFTPIDLRDPGGTDNAASGPVQATLDNKSLAIQKSVAVVVDTGTAGPTPDDTLEYTLTFQISDYYTFGDLLITDVFQDGQLFDFTFGATLDVTDLNSNTIGSFTVRDFTAPDNGETLVVDQTKVDRADDAAEDPASDGSTTLTFDLSQALRDLGEADGVLQGGLSNGPANLGAATGTIRFRTVIQDEFADTFPSGDRSVDQGDAITNSTLSISGTVRENEEDDGNGTLFEVIGPAPDGRESDDSSAGVTIVNGVLTKEVYAINGSTTLPIGGNGKVVVKPGDVVTYRIQYTLPTSDFENLTFTDFLPLPVFNVDDHDGDNITGDTWTFNIGKSFDAIVPVAGQIEFGPSDTFYNSNPGFSDTSSAGYFAPPQITVDTTANSLELLYGTYDDTAHQSTNIDLMFSIVVQDDPMADGLFLTNIVRTEEGSTNQGTQTADQIVQIELTEPNLSITKGAVSTSSPNESFTPSPTGPVTFEAPGSTDPAFTGQIDSTNLAANPIDSNVAGLDAGDLVKFALVIENTGNADAYDLTIADILPAGFQIPTNATGLNLEIRDGNGNLLQWTGVDTGSDSDLFAGGIEVFDPIRVYLASDTTDELTVLLSRDNFDPATNEQTIGPLGVADIEAMARNALDGVLYAADADTLGTINLTTGAFTAIGGTFGTGTGSLGNITFSDVDGLAFNPLTGELYGVHDAGAQNVIFKIDTTTGSFVNNAFGTDDYIALNIAARIDDIAIDKAGVIWGTDATNLIRIDLDEANALGSITTIAAFGSGINDMEGLSADEDGRLWGTTGNAGTAATSDRLWEVDKTTGVASNPRQLDNGGDYEASEAYFPGSPGAINDLGEATGAGDGSNIIIITYDLELTDAVQPNSNHTNNATLSNYSGTDDGPDFTQTDLTDSATAQVTNVSPAKSIVDTSESHTTGTDVAIGEIVRYRLVVELPEGTSTNLQFRDRLPGGLAFLDDGTATVVFVSNDTSAMTSSTLSGAGLNVAGDEATVSGITPTFVLPDSAVSSSASSDNDTYNSGTDVYFKLGDVVNTDDDGNAEFVVIEFNAIVDNDAGSATNDAGDNRNNRFDVNIAGTTEATSSNVGVRIHEPSITNLTKTSDVPGGDAGDTVTFTITYSNASGGNNTNAFDARLLDTLPADYTLNVGSINITLGGGATGATNNSSGNTVDVTVDDIPVGGTVTVTYTATLDAAVEAGEILTNTATLTYTSLPGANGTTSNPTGSSTPGASGSDFGERDGSGNPNDYTDADSVNVTITPVSIVKNLVSTEIVHANNANDEAVIGELVTYQLVVTLPEGNTTGATLVDTLDAGLAFVDLDPASLPVVTAGLLITGSTTPTITSNGGVVTWNFGSVINTNRDNGAAETITLTYRTVVLNDAGNQAGTQLNNSAVFSSASSSPPVANAAQVTVLEPQVTVTKTATPSNGDAGDPVQYDIVLQNNAAVDAFDVTFSDPLPTVAGGSSAILAPTFFVTDTLSIVTDADFELVGSDAAGWTLQTKAGVDFDMPVDPRTITITINGTISPAVTPNQQIGNTATVLWDSLDGDFSSPRSTHNTSSVERDGSDGVGGALNDYAGEGTDTFTVDPPTFTKSLFATDRIETSGSDVTIGETVTYALLVALPEGVTPGVDVVDQIPAGLDYTNFQIITTAAASNGLLAADFSGSFQPGDPMVTGGAGDGDDVTFSFGQIDVTVDNDVSNNAFLILVDALVLDVASNVGYGASPTTLSNIATIDITGDGVGPQASNNVNTTVVEANLTITKEFGGGPPDVDKADAGDNVTIELKVQNTGDGDAYDVVIADVLSAGEYDYATVNLGTPGTEYPADFSASFDGGSGLVQYTGGTIAAGQTVTFTFTVDLTETVAPADVLNNTADITQATTLSGSVAGERDDPDPDGDGSDSDSDSITIRRNSLAGNVYSDADNDSVFDGGEVGIGSVNVRLQGTDHLGNAVDITIPTQPDGSYLFDNLRPGTYSITETQPAAFIDGKDSIGTQGGVPGNDTFTSIVLPTGTETFGTANNFGETEPASLGNFVWYDADGDGVQDAGEPGLPNVDVVATWAGQDDIFGNADDQTFLTSTDQNGLYNFSNLPSGQFRVDVTTEPAGMSQTAETDDGANNIAGVAEILVVPGANRTDVDFGFTGTGSIGDTVYWDANNNGAQDAGEPGLPGINVTLNIDFDQNGSVDHTLNATTDSNGNYIFNNLPAVDYVVIVTQPAGTTQTFDADGLGTPNQSSLTLGSGENNAAQDFGYRGNGSIGDTVFWDVNNNGVQDAGDLGLPGVSVTLDIDLNGDAVPDYTTIATTDNDGNFVFTNLIPGDYTVSVTPATVPGGMSANPTFDADSTATPHTSDLTLGVDENNTAQDFGYTGTASLGDRIWLDANGDGVQDAGEPGLANVDVTITWFGPDGLFGTADDESFSVTTNNVGNYDFANLPSGDFRVDVDQADAPGNTTLTTANDTHDVNLTAGEDHDASDFGFVGGGSIGDFVFFDFNNNGTFDAGTDVAYPGVTVTLTGDIDNDGIDESFVTATDAAGNYNFPGLPFADYTVTLTPPAGTTPTFDSDGTGSPNTSDVTLDAGNPSSADQDFGLTGTGSIGDTIFYDIDGDGIQDGGEPGIVNVTVQLDADLDGDGTPDFTATAVTDQNGNYSFQNIPAGTHTITVTAPAGSNPTTNIDGAGGPDTSHTFALAAGENNTSEDFGFLGTGSIGDTVYWDVNDNGIHDAGEVGLFNVPVRLDIDFDQDGTVDHSLNTTTDIDGNYLFTGLMVADYDVIVTQPAGTTQTDDPDGTNDNQSSLTLADAENNTAQDFGYRGDSSLGDLVFWDVNNNALFDPGTDRGIDGVDVTLDIDFNGDATPDYTQTIQTDANGNYGFNHLVPGVYTVTVAPVTVPGGLAGNPTTDGDGIGTPHTSDVTLGADETNNDQDFGYTGTGSIGDTVFWDANDNAVQDAGEPGLSGVAVTLDVDIDQDGDVDYTFATATDADGNYAFSNLPSGDYDVRITQPDGTTPTFDADGVGTPNQSSLTLADGETNSAQDFGYRGNGSIGDIVFFDYVGDGGPFNPAENDRGMAGVDVTLQIDVNGDSNPDYIVTIQTDANGLYLFENLIPGTYTITTDPTDLPDQMGDNPTYDADGVGPGSQNTSTLVLGVDENNADQDFGYHATPDYNITKDDGLLSVVTGQSISYTITVRNDGTLFGQNVVLADTYPTNILTNVTASDGGIVDPGSGTITWNAATTPALAVLDVGEEIILTVTGDIVAILDGNNEALVNTVNVADDTVNGIDPNLVDNTDQDTDQVVDITTLKNVTNVAGNGDNWDVTFQLIVENTGSVQLEDLTLFDALVTQFGAAFVSVTSPVIDASGVSAGGTPPVANPNWINNTALDILDPAFTSEVLMPGERFIVSFTATLDPDVTGSSTTLDNRATSSGTDNSTDPGNPGTVSDDSDSGTDPTSTNPGEPGDTGTESDRTPLYIPDIAVAKQQGTTTQDPVTHNWFVDYRFFVENIGTVSLDSLTLVDDIAAEFGNAFSGIQAASLTLQNFSGTGISPTVNSAWEGDTSLDMLIAVGARLDPGDSFEVTFTVEVDPDGVDGLSQPLENQATAGGRGLDENGQPLQESGGGDIVVADDSDSGTNPNGNNPNDPGDAGTSDDPTMLVIPEIGVAKRLVSSTPSGTGGNRDLTYEIVIRNLGTVDLTDLTLTEDLDQHFSAAFVGVAGAPTVFASNATQNPTLNAAWDGNAGGAGDAEIFAGNDGLLRPGEQITIRFIAEVDIDQLNSGSNNQVNTSGFYDATPGVAGNEGTVSDLSDAGNDPAGNNPGAPGDSGGFDDPTLIPAIGLAKDHGDFAPADENFVVPITLVLENLGATDLTNLNLIEDLQAAFGAAFVSASSPTIDNSGMAIPANGPGVNSAWPTDTTQNLLDGSGLLQPGDRVVITFSVTVDPDATGTSTPLDNQASISAADPGNPTAVVQDLSDSGSDPSLSNPGQPGDTGSADDPTPLQIADVGLAKQITGSKQLGLEIQLTIQLVLENTGTVDLDNLQLLDDLAAQYGANFDRIVSAPRIVASSATADPNMNTAYAKDTTQNMFDGASGLIRPGESITVRLVVGVVATPGQSETTVVNQAQGGGTARDENGQPLADSSGTPLAPIMDLSDQGSNPNTSNKAGGYDDPTSQRVTFFTFDAFNDFSSGSKGLWEKHAQGALPHTERILTKEISSLAPEPIFSGSARPGTQIVGRVYDSAGTLLGEAISFADVGGNWMMQFHELSSLDHARFEFVELAGAGHTFAPRGDIYGYLGSDARENDYASLEPWTPYDSGYELSAVYRQTAEQSLATVHRMHQRPLGLGSSV